MKSFLYYLLLVGAPFFGLLVILEAGSRIVPPRSIGGVWDVEVAGEDASPSGCALAREMRVSQSGPRSHVTLSDPAQTSFTIELDGDSVRGSLPASEGRGCARATELVARVVTEDGRETMRGELRAADCAECSATPLRATRRPGSMRP
jgi:hypothetical protein